MAKNTSYVSDATKFIKELKQQKPYLKKQQESLRKTWWDKSEDEVTEELELDKKNLKPQSYAYFTYSKE
jgi:hypothetical protein